MQKSWSRPTGFTYRANALPGAAIKASFLSEEFAGTGIICYFETPDGQEWKAQVTETQLATLQPESGQEFWLSWDANRVHVMGR